MNKLFSAFNAFFGLRAKDMVRKQLEDATIDFLTHAKSEEYHATMKVMLNKRIVRLQALLSKLDKQQ